MLQRYYLFVIFLICFIVPVSEEIDGQELQGKVSTAKSGSAEENAEESAEDHSGAKVSNEDIGWPVRHVSEVFKGELEGYPVYRIPGMMVAADGSVLAFCEGRLSYRDPGAAGEPIDLVMKRSANHGKTWSPLEALEDDDDFDYSDPCPILNSQTGSVLLHYTRWPDDKGLFQVPAGTGPDSSNHFILASQDHGASWQGPFNITEQIKKPVWKGLVMGPGHGIVLKWQIDPARNGRFVTPSHIHSTKNFVVFSDDQGATWQYGNLAQNMVGGGQGNENEVVELTNGDVLMNARPSGGLHRRMFRSADGGETWVQSYPGNFDITTCDGSMLRYSAKREGDGRDRILFSGPLGDPAGSGSGRWNIGVRTSYDEGRTFINPVQLQGGVAAYSVMSLLSQDNLVGLIYESVSNKDIRFVSFDVATLENGPHLASLLLYDGFGNRVDRRQGGVGWSGYWTGDASFTGAFDERLEGADVPYAGYNFDHHEGRVDLIEGDSIVRELAVPIDMNSNETMYISLLFTQRLDDSQNDPEEEELIVTLQDENGQAHVAFGVDSDESYFIVTPGDALNSAPGLMKREASYMLWAKVLLRDNRIIDNCDRIYIVAYESGVDRIPLVDKAPTYTLKGTANQNTEAKITHLKIQGSPNATWSIDELRIGTTHASVTHAPQTSNLGGSDQRK